MTPKTYNWAILGCGKIARKFSSDLKLLPNARLYAAASRSMDKAIAFAGEFGFEKAYGSYDEMVRDPQVDIVYVATPHSHHMEHAILCLDHGKAVLCEKAFALNADQVNRMIEAARRNGVFLMEAFWTRFQPAFLKLMEVLASGQLGRPKMLRSDFAFNGGNDLSSRLFNMALGGGSLLDIGIYPVFIALQAFGRPEEIKTFADLAPTGADRSITMLFRYPDGQMASLASSFAVCSDTQSEVWCEKGFIRIRRKDISSTHLTVWRDNGQEEDYDFINQEGSGYHLEAQHVMLCLDEGLTESRELPLSFSSLLIETLDRIRKDAGIVYPD
ncbi:MAG: Gfo/Idh/MocA family oxidoreductase [Bacteroidales bacterium]|nr:Gfo/Idh/MocA family oxidoreductase [Bacteroidales bacterium]